MTFTKLFRRSCLVLAIALASTAQAGAAVLYTISGVVGDANWKETANGFELKLSPIIFPGTGAIVFSPGASGSVEIAYSGAAIQFSNDQFFYNSATDYYRCNVAGGCPTGNLTYIGGDNNFPFYGTKVAAPVGATEFSRVLDTTEAITTNMGPQVYTPDTFNPALPPLSQGGVYSVSRYQIFGFGVDEFVSGDAVGQAYSFTISSVPEPATWAMFLLGFGSIGFMLRTARRKQAMLAA